MAKGPDGGPAHAQSKTARHLAGRKTFARGPHSAITSPMFPKPRPALKPNTYEYESAPLVKPTGFREYDVRWLLGKEINLMGVEALGLGLGTLICEMGVK